MRAHSLRKPCAQTSKKHIYTHIWGVGVRAGLFLPETLVLPYDPKSNLTKRLSLSLHNLKKTNLLNLT